jgi:Protein of unknown function (DUF4019)
MPYSRTWRAQNLLVVACGVTALALWFSSCGITANKPEAEAAVGTFHSQLDAGQFDAIYANADGGFRKATTNSDFDAFASAVHRKLGTVRQASLTNYFVNWSTGEGEVITLTYNTQFSGGSATEQFRLRLQNNRPLIYGYNIDSTALILK